MPNRQPVTYVLHFQSTIGNPDKRTGTAGHYTGTTYLDRLPKRMEEHRGKTGSSLTRAFSTLGIPFVVSAVFQGGNSMERRLKNLGSAKRYCPQCGATPPSYAIPVKEA